MKFVKILINNIFIPFATFLFILVGVFAALLSAIIEFAVLKELFTSEYQEFIPSFLIALALVLLLEYSKLYLHYLLGRWKHKPDSNSAKYMKKVRIIVSIPTPYSNLSSLKLGIPKMYHLILYCHPKSHIPYHQLFG